MNDMRTWSHYQSLDLWRGFAALWVMVFHGFGSLYDQPLHPWVAIVSNFAKPGWIGVHLFFVVSGYCIAVSVYRLLQGQENALIFLKKRAWRLLPTYWSAFLLTLLINLGTAPLNGTSFASNMPSTGLAWLGNLFLIQPYLQVPFYGVVYWSLVVEVGFYVIVALLLLLNQIGGIRLTLWVGIALAFASSQLPKDFVIYTLPYWCEFCCGVLLFLALLFKFEKNQSGRVFIALSLISILGGISIFQNLQDQGNQLWFSSLFALLLFVLHRWDKAVSQAILLKIFKNLGLISYSLYLIHVPIAGRVINLGLRYIGTQDLGLLGLELLSWTIAIAASYVFYLGFERPFAKGLPQKTTVSGLSA